MIPVPPKVPKQNSQTYRDVTWTAEQVDFALQMVINQITSGVEFKTRCDGGNRWTITNSSSIFIAVENSYYTHMILDGDASGSFFPKRFPWRDRQVKKSIKQLLYILNNKAKIAADKRLIEATLEKREIAMKSLFNAFPEAITQEFEKHVLESKDGCKVVPGSD